FSELTKHITSMMKPQTCFKWDKEGKSAFEEIKKAIAKAPTLVSPDFNKDFIMYCYASEHTLFVVLAQKNDEGLEAPIAFMSCPLKNHELKYSQLEKHAYAVVKAVKSFRFYILNSHTVVMVPGSAIKSILTQQDPGAKRGSWMEKTQEFDLEIRPSNLVRGN
ncbi:hypothetical protein KI387_040042, partial [Taxus chinensis]